MYQHSLRQFAQPITIIHPGEYLASAEDIIICTVLGSCIAVALRDETAGVGGLNHFMLSGSFRATPDGIYREGDSPPLYARQDAKYGMYAMELLINDLLKLGARKERLRAKVFGGASVMGIGNEAGCRVCRDNQSFALTYLDTEGIPILAQDLGGDAARKVLFFVKDGKVLLKKIKGTYQIIVSREEQEYRERIAAKTLEGGSITLFK